MNKKVIITVVALIVAIAIVVLAVMLVNNGSENTGAGDGQNVSELNLQELNTTISAKVPYSEMSMQDINDDTLQSLYEIDASLYDEVIGRMPMMNIQASMYLVIKAKDGSVDAVKEKVDAYGQNQERIWSTYLPEQYDLVKNRKLGVVGNYVYLIIGETAEEIETLVKQ